MPGSLIEQHTEYWYAWEERGRGWRTYDKPVLLEPPFDPYAPPSAQTQPYVDDGKVETVVSLIKKGIGSLFKKDEPTPPKPEKPDGFSYPDTPYPFDSDSPLHCYRVSLPKKQDVDTKDAEKLLHMLAFSVSQVSFEILGTAEGIYIQWACRAEDTERLLTQLRAYFPLLAIQEVPAYELPFYNDQDIAIVDLGLENEFLLPLASGSKFAPDPFIGIIAAMESLAYGETGMVQVIFHGTEAPWGSLVVYMAQDGTGGSFFEDMPELPKLAQEKASGPLYGVVLRVIGQGSSRERSSHIASNLINSIIAETRSKHNTLMPLSNGGYPFEKHIESVFERTSHRLGMLLNSKELVTLVHIPSSSVTTPKLSRQTVKSKPVPQALTDGRYAIGGNMHLSREQIVWLTDQQRLKHMHIIGATGTGKSTFITNLVLQDCDAGNGCIVFDPHGDLIDDIIPRIGAERIGDVILIDPSDTEYPIGFNLLEAKTELEKIILSSDLVETFKEKSIAWGDTIQAVLTNAINAFLESSRGGTLLELRKFLLDTKFRYSILNTIEDPAIRSYWQHEYPQLKKGAISPLLTRLDTFLRPKMVRNMMAQKKGVDFKEVLAGNKIVLVKLSQGLIGDANSYLLGTLLLAKVYQAAQARQSMGKDDRQPFYVYIDEFYNFLTPSLAAILSGARKYGLGLVLAHQELSQIQDTGIGNSVLSNPGIRVCFRVGDNDAQKLEKGFSYFDASDLQNLSTGECIVRVERSDWDFNMHTGEPSLEEMDENHFARIREQTRMQYATPVSEIDAIVQELYQFETPPAKGKEVKPTKSPVEEEPENIAAISETEMPEVIAPKQQPAIDIEAAAQKYLESTEKQREKREHLYMQNFIKKMAEQRGFKAELEAPTQNGGRIDILLIRDELKIACELSVTNTAEYEVKNLQKCIDAGYANIVMLCSNETHLRNIKAAASELSNSSLVQFLSPDRLYAYLDTFAVTETVKETRTRGYRIKTTYNTEPTHENDEIVKSTLLQSLKRK